MGGLIYNNQMGFHRHEGDHLPYTLIIQAISHKFICRTPQICTKFFLKNTHFLPVCYKTTFRRQIDLEKINNNLIYVIVCRRLALSTGGSQTDGQTQPGHEPTRHAMPPRLGCKWSVSPRHHKSSTIKCLFSRLLSCVGEKNPFLTGTKKKKYWEPGMWRVL